MNNLNKFFRGIETQVRSSLEYDNWIKRNKATACYKCNTQTNLECHHIPELYQTILALWRFYGDKEAVFEHAKLMHDTDKFVNATLCQNCHAKKHPGRAIAKAAKNNFRTDIWTTIARNLNTPFTHSTIIRPRKALGLLGFQTLLGLGWHILNGHFDSRIIEIHQRRFAELLGKSPSTSFNYSLNQALKSLQQVGILAGHSHSGNTIEVIFEPEYLTNLGDNPWFLSLDDIKTNSMCVLTLRWFLGMQSNRKTYRIGIDKLKGHIGMRVVNQGMAIKAIKKACEAIEWAEVDIEKGMCSFTLQRRGATPIFSLREILRDSLGR